MVLEFGKSAARAGWRYSKKAFRLGFVMGTLSGLAGGAMLYATHREPEVEMSGKSSPPLTGTIRAMSANVAAGLGREHRVSDFFSDVFYDTKKAKGTPPLEKLIREENIDIACFQEIEHSYIIGGEDQPKRVASTTPLKNYAFGQNFTFDLFGRFFANGNSIHSTTQLYEAKRIPQQKYTTFGWADITRPFFGSKAFTHVKVNYQGEKLHEINVFCAHLSAKQMTFDGIVGKEHEREDEMRQLMELAAQNTPAIVMGDFNTVPLGARMQMTYPHGTDYAGEKTWIVADEVAKEYGVEIHSDERLHIFDTDTAPDMPTTYVGHADGRWGQPLEADSGYRKVIDYVILVTRSDDPIRLKLDDTRVVHRTIISDHAPVISDISVEEK